ncbi:MAG: DNA-3-methyladenine glycosylase [Cyclobacteriaceae bacterium]
MKLSKDFYLKSDVAEVARALLGKFLVTNINDHLTTGIIVETEAYSGRNDKACHANNGRRTKRTEIMFLEGGKSYVYLCYGIHHLFNVTTNVDGLADAVLIRAIEPVEGVEIMMDRRKKKSLQPSLTAGPGSMAQALGITTKLYGADLLGEEIWIEDRGVSFSIDDMIACPRVGVAYAEEDAHRPWRFAVRDNLWVSKSK